eukprot:44288-Amphidinium_carterae.1
MMGNGRVSLLYSCPHCLCAPLRMNGWVRGTTGGRKGVWFCPACVEKWTHSGGNSTRWVLIWEEEFDWEDLNEQRGPGWRRVGCLEPGQAAQPPTTATQHQQARGVPIIYQWGHHAANIDNWADNVFTYLKRCQLATNLGGTALSLDAVIKTLREIDEAHFQRLSETLNVEQIFFQGFDNHPKWGGVYRLECSNAYLSCRAKGQQ